MYALVARSRRKKKVRTVTTARSEEGSDLITKGSIVGMLHDGPLRVTEGKISSKREEREKHDVHKLDSVIAQTFDPR